MGEAMVLSVEIAALIQLRLQAFVVDHRLHAVLIGESEIKQLQLQRYLALLTVGCYGHRAGVDPGRQMLIGIDLDPDWLVRVSRNVERKSATTPTRILR